MTDYDALLKWLDGIEYSAATDAELRAMSAAAIRELWGIQDLYIQACEQRDDALALLTKVSLRKSCEGTQPYICHGLATARAEVERLTARLTKEIQNKKEFERDWLQASDKQAAAEARLAEAERLMAEWFGDPCEEYEQDCVGCQAWKFLGHKWPADSASAVQPERCCLDYPRCDCNSPPEPDNAPTLQPCGHPWESQPDYDSLTTELAAVKARLAEAGRLLRIVEDADYMSHIPKDEIRGWLGTADSADGAT